MQNSIWKLTALAGLVGIGFLVVLQAQRGMPGPDNDEVVASNDGGGQAEASPSGTGRKPRSHESDVEQALLFGQREPFEDQTDDGPAADRSHSIAEFEPEDRAGGSRTSPEHGPARPGFEAEPVGDERESADANPPERLFVGDARPLTSPPAEAPSGEHSESDAVQPSRPDAFTSNPFAADAEAVEVVIQPRRAEPRPAAASTVSPASSESRPGASAGPQLLMAPAAEDESGIASPDETGSEIAREDMQPIPESGQPVDPESDAAPPFAIGAATPEAAEADNAWPDAFEELPPPDGDDLSIRERSTDADDAPHLDESPAVADDPFPDAGDNDPKVVTAEAGADADFADGAPVRAAPTPAAASAADRSPSGAEVAVDREPARLPVGEGGQEPKPLDVALDGSRVVSLESDDLRGDGTVGADGPKGSQQPQLTIEKQAPALAVLGQPLVYSIIVRNVGSSPAHQVVVEDRIPKGSRLTGTIPRAELIQKRLVWKVGVLKPGEEQRIAVRIVPVEEGQIGSIATVNFVAEVASRTRITAPRLELTLTGPGEARLGQPVLFTFRLSNQGEGTASGVYLRNIIPDELRHESGNDLEYKVGDLKAGESREVSLTVVAAKPGAASNRAVLTADGGLSVESSAEIEISGNRLRLERSGPKRRFVGRDGEFTNTVINDSDDTLSAVAVVETVPAGLDFVEASHGGRWNSTTRAVTWTIGQMAPRERASLSVRLVCRAAGNQSSEVHVRSAAGDEAQVASATQVEGLAALDLSVADNKSPIDVGETITLRIVARNRGSQAASNVRVGVAVPPEMEFVSARGPGDHAVGQDGRIEFAPIAQLGGRSQEELLLVLKAVAAGSGDARVEITIDADQMARPLNREEAVYILPETP